MTVVPHSAIPSAPAGPDEAGRAIRAALAGRRPGASICPTDAARQVAAARGETAPDAWRRHLAAVRRAAGDLASRGEIIILRKGRAVDPDAMRGVIRLRLPGVEAETTEET
jgi:DNA-binding NarL/FixJ family response regulator